MKEKKIRQLAAIMFTDIEGYTALMQGDEHLAMQVRARHREVFKAQHDVHGGKILQYFGDGTLSVFQSGVQAVECAIAMQQDFATGQQVPLRIGIHIGDIVFDGTDIYGDSVNLASRIESLGMAGSILLSAALNEELKNHQHIHTQALGFFHLKNVGKPIEVFAVSNDGIKIPAAHAGKGKLQAKSIAVLPFVNMSTSAENEYFSDGITEEIINALAKIKRLKVTSRTSSFYFKNKNIPIKEIGRELNVSAILEGSVRVAGDKIRITAQLIQAEEDFHFWSHSWDRKLENIFEIQDEISLEIAHKLREHFGHIEIRDHLVEKQTDSLDAYQYSLKARYHFNKWNPEDARTAIELWEKAVALDPKHTESYVGLADAYGFMATTQFMPYEEAWGKSAGYTYKALALSPDNAGVHYLLANLSFFTKADFQESFQHARKSIELMPNYPEAQQFMSFLYMLSGDVKKARHHLQRALDIDPFNQETLFYKAFFHYRTEDYLEALDMLEQCLGKNPKNLPAYVTKCYCLLMLGRHAEVLQYLDQMPKEIAVPGDQLGITCLAYILDGNEVKAQKYLAQLSEEAKEPFAVQQHSYLFQALANMGENDKAFEWLEKAMALKSSILLLGFSDPLAKPLQNDPRYALYQNRLYGKMRSAKTAKQKPSLLDEKTVEDYTNRLFRFVADEAPYLNPNLSLRSLAEQVEIHPNQLSWLFNESIGKNFNEFINYYRVETFKKLAANPDNANISLLGLAYESGFNSKTVFNTYFKKEVGMTPKEFLKSNGTPSR